MTIRNKYKLYVLTLDIIGELKRVQFERGNQRLFLLNSKKKLNLPWTKVSKKLKIKFGTLRSYSNELCSLPLTVVKDVCKFCNWNFNEVLRRYNGREQVLSSSDLPFQKGYGFGKRRIEVNEIRTKSVKQTRLDLSRVEFSSSDKEKGIRLPKLLDEYLAEETGVHLGDGFLSGKKYDFRVKGDRTNEMEYYDDYLKKLYKRLYNLEINNRDYGDSYGFEIYSKGIWTFKTNTLGITPGKKDKIRIPKLIRDAGTDIHCAFLRGIMDTDGSIVFRLQHTRNRYYPAISVTCKSEMLARDIHRILKGIGFAAKLYHKTNGFWDVYLYGYANYDLYMKCIGWRNQKNLKKVRERNALMAAVV